MATPQNVNQQAAVQSAQQGVAPMDFDPDVIMQEISAKGIQLQLKERELAEREQAVMKAEAMNQNASAQGAQTAQANQAAATTPAVPMSREVKAPIIPPGAEQKTPGAEQDISPQTAANLQIGQKVTVTKKFEATQQGLVEVGRSENISSSTGAGTGKGTY